MAWNYRLPNLNAALGCAQMERLPNFLHRKRLLAKRYQEVFGRIGGIKFVTEPQYCQSNYWLNTILLESSSFELRDHLLTTANDASYQCRPTWTLLNKLPMYSNCPCAPLPVAERLEVSLINVPSSAKLLGR